MKNPPLCKRAATLALPLALLTLPAIAAAAPADEVPLAEIVVKGQGLGVSRHQPYSVQQFSAEDFRERQVAQPRIIDEAPLNEIGLICRASCDFGKKGAFAKFLPLAVAIAATAITPQIRFDATAPPRPFDKEIAGRQSGKAFLYIATSQ